MATKVEKLLLQFHLEQKENDALRDRIEALELSLRTAAHERKVLQTKITSLEKKLLEQHASDPGLSARQEAGLLKVKSELMSILDESVLPVARREFYERHIRDLDTDSLVALLRNMQFVDSMK